MSWSQHAAERTVSTGKDNVFQAVKKLKAKEIVSFLVFLQIVLRITP